MAIVATLDAVLLTYAVLLLLLALDYFDGLDVFLLSLHLLHIFTVLMSYVVVRHATTSLDTLRMLLMVYFLMMIIDSGICFVRVLFLGHSDDDETSATHQHIGGVVRVMLALSFVMIDIGGAIFTNVAQHTAVQLHYTNNDLFDLADEAMALQQQQQQKTVGTVSVPSSLV